MKSYPKLESEKVSPSNSIILQEIYRKNDNHHHVI